MDTEQKSTYNCGVVHDYKIVFSVGDINYHENVKMIPPGLMPYSLDVDKDDHILKSGIRVDYVI